MTDRLLLIFVKNPLRGKVKTRLAHTVGENKALDIYMKLLDHTAKITRDLPLDKVVYYSEFIDQKDLWDYSVYQKKLQTGGDLGQRMSAAFARGFKDGYRQICIIGSDCYELTPEIIMSGFHALNTHDAVLGPTQDGGYYLLGLKEMKAGLFENKQWGTSSVALDTLFDLQEMKVGFKLLKMLIDIDEESDLGSF